MQLILLRASLGYLWRHPWQLLLSVIGVSIGVAVIIAVDLANSSARAAFLQSMDAVTGATTHQVVGGSEGVREATYAALRVQHGADTIAPIIEGEVFIDGQNFEVLGIDLFAETTMQRFSSALSGGDALFADWLVVPGAVALSASQAKALGAKTGDTLRVQVAGRSQAATVVAVFASEGATALDSLLLVDVATAQEWFDMAGFLSRIDVIANSPAAVDVLRAALPGDARLLDAEGRTRATLDLAAAFMTNLQAMSLLALLVGAFLIYNSMSFSVLQRRYLIGQMRTLGVTRREIILLIFVEAAAIGLMASALGLLLGTLLGKELLWLVSRSINDLYFKLVATDVQVDQWSIYKGLAAGLLTSLIASIVPAIEALSFSPNRALQRSSAERATGRALPWMTAVGCLMLLLAVLIMMASGRSLLAGLIAVFMLIFGFALCIPLLVRAFARALARVAPDALSKMAIRDIPASLSRTGVAIVALTVAVSATIGVTLMVDSFRGSVSRWLDTALQADIYVSTRQGYFDAQLMTSITRSPEVKDFSTSQRITLESEVDRLRLQVVDMATGAYAGTELLDGNPEEVWRRWENEATVLISEPFAYRSQLHRGDTLRIPTDQGAADFTVVSRFQSYDVNATGIMMSRQTFNRFFRDRDIESLGLYLFDPAQSDAFIAALEQRAGDRLQIYSNTKVRAMSLAVFDQTFAITGVLYWLAMVVAIIGILSSMLALQLEKTREHGVLRALGMTPWQLARVIQTQTGVMGLLGGLASIPLGIAMAYVLIAVINRRAFGWQIDILVAPGTLLDAVIFAVAAAVVAGFYPSLKAATVRPAQAMRED